MGRNRWVRTALSLFVSAAMVSGARVAAQTGRHLYEQKCGRCHTVVEPDEYSAEEWPGVVRSMKAQAALSQQEYAGIVEYLVSSAGEEGGKSGGGRPVVGGYLYSEYFQTEERTKNFDIHYLSLYANDRIYYFGEFELEHTERGDQDRRSAHAVQSVRRVSRSSAQLHHNQTPGFTRNRSERLEGGRGRSPGLSESQSAKLDRVRPVYRQRSVRWAEPPREQALPR